MLIICCVPASAAKELPELVVKHWENLSMQGSTRLSRFGIHIYDASFWTESHINTKDIENSICALNIEYARSISAKRLIKSTQKEWQRLGYTDALPTDVWLETLTNMWPDVEQGDKLVVVSIPNEKSLFYDRNGLIGSIHDPDFGPAFLAIWLSDAARFQKNKRELLNE